MVKESKCCSDLMKKDFNKDRVMIKKDNEDFKKSTKFWTCNNGYVDGDGDIKVRDYCHVTGKYRGSKYTD